MEEDVEVHEDEQISCFVRTLRLLFYAALSVSDEDDWRLNLKKSSEVQLIEEESVEKMEVDDPDKNSEKTENTQMSEDDKNLNDLLHAKRDARESEDQDPLAKRLKLDWCNLSRPRIPYDEFKNETINNGDTYKNLNFDSCLIYFFDSRNIKYQFRNRIRDGIPNFKNSIPNSGIEIEIWWELGT